MHFFKALYSPFSLALIGYASSNQKYSTWMLESIISRGEGVGAADGLLGGIQKGFFQEVLRAAVESTNDIVQAQRWSDYHSRSVQTGLDDLLDATADAKAPLDRLCAGRSLLQSSTNTRTARAALQALRKSIDLQLRSANGGLWYFADPPSPPYESYHNLSYSDGMYGFAPFVTLYGRTYGDTHLSPTSTLHQLELIHTHCLHRDTGLLVHGYDASRRAPWADPVTGASSIVWGRSLAWYTIGLVDTLEIADADPGPDLVHVRSVERMRAIFRQLALAAIATVRKSARTTARYGVWQVFDMPGQPDNFVEASASAMLTYALAKGIRLGYLDSGIVDGGETHYLRYQQSMLSADESAVDVVCAMYRDLLAHFVVRDGNGMLDYVGTSAIASLHVPKPDYNYYTHRNVTTNSLIGTSAFVLASLEMERL